MLIIHNIRYRYKKHIPYQYNEYSLHQRMVMIEHLVLALIFQNHEHGKAAQFH